MSFDDDVKHELINALGVILIHYKGINPETINANMSSNDVFSLPYHGTDNSERSDNIEISDKLKPLLTAAIEKELALIKEIKSSHAKKKL